LKFTLRSNLKLLWFECTIHTVVIGGIVAHGIAGSKSLSAERFLSVEVISTNVVVGIVADGSHLLVCAATFSVALSRANVVGGRSGGGGRGLCRSCWNS